MRINAHYKEDDMENALHKLVIILLNYLAYKDVSIGELLDFLNTSDDEGKRQLYLLFEYEVECMDEIEVPWKDCSDISISNEEIELEL